MDQQDELRARRDALESELLSLERQIQGYWQRCAAAPVELLERVDALLGRLRSVNSKLSELSQSAP